MADTWGHVSMSRISNGVGGASTWPGIDSTLLMFAGLPRLETDALCRHGSNFKQSRAEFPLLDGAVSALVQDLHERGLDKDVSVIVWGEFGRTPKINGHRC